MALGLAAAEELKRDGRCRTLRFVTDCVMHRVIFYLKNLGGQSDSPNRQNTRA
jgi:hypothetical protein